MRNTTRTARRAVLPLALVAVTAVAGAACSSDSNDDGSKDASSTTAQNQTTTTSAADGGEVVTASGPIALSVDGRATIRLDANPTTGYQWEPVSAPDDAVIRVVSDHYNADDSNVVGRGGTQELVIEGTGEGTTTLELQYVRPWETGVAAAETASFEITVS